MSDEVLKYIEEKYGKDSDNYKRMKKSLEAGKEMHKKRYELANQFLTPKTNSIFYLASKLTPYHQ